VRAGAIDLILKPSESVAYLKDRVIENRLFVLPADFIFNARQK
jgi:hypothetical protein